MSFLRHILPITVVMCGVVGTAQADERFVIQDIRLEGLARLSAASVYASLPVSAGDRVDDTRLAEVLRALFKTGNFEDVQVGRDGDVLVIRLTERPEIVSLDIKGNKSIEKDNLLKGLKSAGLAEGMVFQRSVLDHVKRELERQYIAQGRYGASIVVEAKAKPRNRVALNIQIEEGKPARISGINFVGNKVFNDEELRSIFQLRPTHFTSFYKNDDKYSREKLQGDLERLRSWYMDRGYVNFVVNSTQVTLTADKKDVFIDLNISEGEQFRFGEIRIAGELTVSEDILKRLLLVRKDDIFNQGGITNTSKLMTRRLGNDGYIFGEVNGVPDIHDDTKVADVTFFVNPGKRAYVRRVNFNGNMKTDDQVLRREMRQFEGALASSEKLDLSKLRLQRLGYFEEVTIDTPRVPGVSDQVDVNVSVKEQPSGTIGASIGFSQGAGMIFSANVSQTNFLGTGNRFSIALNRSETQDSYNLSFVDPYFTLDGVSRGYNLFYRVTKFDARNVSNYVTNSMGGNMSFGYPIDENESINFSIGLDKTDITKGTLASKLVTDFVNTEGDRYLNYTASLSWGRNTLNRGMFADRGISQSVGAEFSLPGSDLSYYKLSYKGQLFIPLGDTWVTRLHTSLGYGDSYGDTSRLPFYKNYFAGGFGSVRGYSDNTLGAKSCSIVLCPNDPYPEVVGGNILIEGGAELIVPTPFAAGNRQLRTVLFYDIGNAYDTSVPGYGVDLSLLRSSVGVNLQWLTAIGPLSFSLSRPLNKQADDDTQAFQFTIGQGF
ncbi:MAG TPA: outer membrane protein assembly factor BamA [Moraxellaceae bacterium]|jgi:outer membrane protein insertion porin family|nr:outer membrane protein assembly factor BamA [Moraxellaceae bacterium]HQV40580.1 outer membrane protein assembly factor BamA [Moraxellaceae bacterium]HQX88808.1 outer membrane protein assembly factor BamA [Moraxellaceae bacterium]